MKKNPKIIKKNFKKLKLVTLIFDVQNTGKVEKSIYYRWEPQYFGQHRLKLFHTSEFGTANTQNT